MHERYYASSSLFTVCNYPHNANILKIGIVETQFLRTKSLQREIELLRDTLSRLLIFKIISKISIWI